MKVFDAQKHRTPDETKTILNTIKLLNETTDENFIMDSRKETKAGANLYMICPTQAIIMANTIMKHTDQDEAPDYIDYYDIETARKLIGIMGADNPQRDELLFPKSECADWTVTDKTDKRHVPRQRVMSQFWYFNVTGAVDWNPEIIAAHEAKHPLPNLSEWHHDF